MRTSLAISLTAASALVAHAATAPDEAVSKPALSIHDTVSFREVREVCLSPSGRTVAFVLRCPNLATGRNEDQLMLLDATTGTQRPTFTGTECSRLAWSGDERFVYSLDRRPGEAVVMRVDAGTGEVRELWRTSQPVGGFAVFPAGGSILISETCPLPPDEAIEQQERGSVYLWGRHSFRSLWEGSRKEPASERFVRISADDGSEFDVGRLPFDGFRPGEFVRMLSVSPDGHLAVAQLQRLGDPTQGGSPLDFDLEVLELPTGKWRKIHAESRATEQGAVWLGDSERFFYVSDGKGFVYDLASGRSAPLDWIPDRIDWVQGGAYDPSSRMLYLQTRTMLLRLDLGRNTVERTSGLFANPSFCADYSRYAFVQESSTSPPEIAVCDMAGGAVQSLTHLNPELDGRSLAKVERIEVINDFGTRSDAYLVWPVGYNPGQRYPLIVGTYGFRGRFLTVAEWHSSFPVQTLAGRGYAVLLVNLPSLMSAQKLPDDPARARENEGWQVQSTFESSIRRLISQGLADSDRVGLYGWSHGVFVVEFLLAHSRMKFRAACVGEGGDYNPGGYWLWGMPTWPKIFQNAFGGPLTARTAASYLEFSPVLSVDRIDTPLLMEFRREAAVAGLEFLVPLRTLGKPAELVSYDGEEHNFVRPGARFASMNRKVDWFDYWMQGKADPDPAKAEQYARWRKMKSEWETKKAENGANLQGQASIP